MADKIWHYDLCPDEWIAGTVGLSLMEEGLFMRACVLIYSHGGPINVELLKRACSGEHGNRVNACLDRLVELGKLIRNGSEIDQKRCRKEIEKARKRVGKARENGAKGGRPNGLAKPAGSAREKLIPIPIPEEKATEPLKRAPVAFSSSRDAPARDATPPLPSQGATAPPLCAPPDPPNVFTDPALKAEAVAAFDRALDALKGKGAVLQADVPVPPDPALIAFRLRLQKLNTIASERLRGDTRWQAWTIIGEASAIGDPLAMSPDMLADLDAIEAAGAYAQAAD